MATTFVVDDDIAENFRGAVRSKYGNKAHGKMKQEIKLALNNHAKTIKKE
jgi:hypothetical protein